MSTTYNLPITPPTLPTGFCFESWQQIANELVGGATVQFLTDGAPTQTIKSSTAPAAADRDKLWFNLNDSRIYFYGTSNGLSISAWVSEHLTPPSGAERRIWVGSTGDLQTYDGGDTGIEDEASGPMWEVDTAFAALFPVGVGTFASGATVAVTGTGGEEKHTLTTAEMPAHTHTFDMEEETSGSGYQMPLTEDTPNNTPYATGTTSSTGGGQSHNNLPPFYGVFFIKRSSRIYYRQ